MNILLEISGVARSTYYYGIGRTDKDKKNEVLIDRMKEIFLEHKGMYGYHRITAQLRNDGSR